MDASGAGGVIVMVGFTMLFATLMVLDRYIKGEKAAQKRTSAALRPGFAWVHMSTKTLSGKGVSLTREAAIEKSSRLAATPLKRPLVGERAIDAVEQQLFANVDCLHRRSPIMVSGDLRRRAGARVRPLLEGHFNLVYMVDPTRAHRDVAEHE